MKRLIFILIFISFSTTVFPQWLVDGGNLIWPYGDVTITNGYLTTPHEPITVDYNTAIFSDSTWWDANQPCFRVYVDDSLGNDLNNGGTWLTAKKTIQSALDALPINLKTLEAFIIIHPGTYSEDIRADKFHNGTLTFLWVGTFINQGEGTDSLYETWVKGAQLTPVRNNNPIIFEAQGNYPEGVLFGNYTMQDLNINFFSRNLDYSWSDVGSGYYDRFQFKVASGKTVSNNLLVYRSNGTLATTRLFFDPSFAIYMEGVTQAGIFLDGAAGAEFRFVHVIGGSTTGSTNTGNWYGALSKAGTGQLGVYTTYNMGWAVGYEPPTANCWTVEGVKQIFVTWVNVFNFDNIVLDFSTMDWTQGSLPSADHQIRLHWYFSGKLTYSSEFTTLQDDGQTSGNGNHKIIDDTYTSLRQEYINTNLIDRGDSLFYKGTAIAP